MRYGTRYGSQIARDMTAGPPGGVPSVLTERARDEGIARMIAAGYARQEAAKEAEAARAYAEANRLTPAQERAASPMPAARPTSWGAPFPRSAGSRFHHAQ